MNLKKAVARKQNRPNFRKNDYFLPPDTHSVVSFVDSLISILPAHYYFRNSFHTRKVLEILRDEAYC